MSEISPAEKIEAEPSEERKSRARRAAGRLKFALAVGAGIGGFVVLPILSGYKTMEQDQKEQQDQLDGKDAEIDALTTLSQDGFHFSDVDTIAGSIVVDMVSESNPSCEVGFVYSEGNEPGQYVLRIEHTDAAGHPYDEDEARTPSELETIMADICPQG